MGNKSGWLVITIVIVSILGMFQWWAKSAREREWWWFHGGPDHMAYADLSSSSKFEGHLLIVDRETPELAATEFNVSWTCKPREFSWGEAWSLNENYDQLTRTAPPEKLSAPSEPRNPMEERFLTLACDLTRNTPQVFKLGADQSPIEITNGAFQSIKNGLPPHKALELALSE